MKELMNEILPLLQPILVLILGFVGNKIRLYINGKIALDKQKEIENVVRASVTFVEQVTGQDLEVKGQAKFLWAKERASAVLKGMGLEVNEEYLDTLIEAFVFELAQKGER